MAGPPRVPGDPRGFQGIPLFLTTKSQDAFRGSFDDCSYEKDHVLPHNSGELGVH